MCNLSSALSVAFKTALSCFASVINDAQVSVSSVRCSAVWEALMILLWA